MLCGGRVDFTGSCRSSTHQSRSSPYSDRVRHELPHPARPGSRDGQRLEARLRHCEVDQVLGHACLLKGLGDHLAIASGARQAVFQRGRALSGSRSS